MLLQPMIHLSLVADRMHDMTEEELYEKVFEVRSELDRLITQYFQLHCAAARLEGECLPDHVVLTEFITVCAWQSHNDRGQRAGDVRLLLREGSIPLYVARGMLSSAVEQVNAMGACNCHGENEDDN